MINISIIMLLFVLHFVGDFILQSDKMAQNKSTSLKWLSIHSAAYIVPFALVLPFCNAMEYLIPFLVANVLLHGLVDSITSKITSKLWKEEKIHWFFTTIGYDQMTHALLLLGTYYVCI